VIIHHLISAFRAVIATSPADLLPMVYLCTNRVAPAHDGVELGIGDAILIKVGWLAGWLRYTVAWLLDFWLAGDRPCRTIALHRRCCPPATHPPPHPHNHVCLLPRRLPASSSTLQALAQATGRKETAIKSEYGQSGDLGVVACNSRGKQKTMFQPPPLTLAGVSGWHWGAEEGGRAAYLCAWSSRRHCSSRRR
jgi:hypothetical protein